MHNTNKIGIIGTGLIGGSLAASLSGKPKYEIFCYNRRIETSVLAKNLGYVTKFFDSISELTKNSDVIIICTPLKTYKDVAKEIAKELTEDKIISDVGSVKLRPSEEIIFALPAKLRSSFVPAHPIAGSERTGIEAADKELFNGKKLIITPLRNTSLAKVNVIKKMWEDAGSNIVSLDAKEHDQIYAKVSHLPQLLSFTYKKAFAKQPFLFDENNPEYREFTRLTNSDENLWADIFEYNAIQLITVLEEFKGSLEQNLNYSNIPIVLAKALNGIISDEEREFAGTGLKSYLAPLSDNFKFQHQEKSFITDFINSMIDEI